MKAPFKMKAGKEGPMKKNFGIGSPMKKEPKKKLRDIENVQERISESKKRRISNSEFLAANPGMFEKDEKGIYRTSSGKTISEMNV